MLKSEDMLVWLPFSSVLGEGLTFISPISQPTLLPYFVLVLHTSYYPHLKIHRVMQISGEYKVTILSFQDLYDFCGACQTDTVLWYFGKGFVISFIYIFQIFVSFFVFSFLFCLRLGLTVQPLRAQYSLSRTVFTKIHLPLFVKCWD